MMGRYLEEGAGSSSTGNGSYGMMGGSRGMMGYGSVNQSSSSSGGWPTGAIVAVAVLGVVLIGGLLALALPRMRGRSGRGRPSPASPGS
jgi:hypothetical protein